MIWNRSWNLAANDTWSSRGNLSETLPPAGDFFVPGIDDHQLKEEDWEMEGDHASISAKVLMKALYGARACRRDLLHSTSTLAHEVAKWSKKL